MMEPRMRTNARSAPTDDEATRNRRWHRGSSLRRAVQLSYLAAGIWAAGNALTGTVLITYLAQEFGAQGSEIGWLLAAPALVGLLRLFTPRLAEFAGGLKPLCLATSTASYVLLAGIPLLAWQGVPEGDRRAALWSLVAVFCASQLLEQIGTVALWSWLGHLVPRRLLGRYFGRRTMLQLAVVIPTLLASAAAADRLKALYSESPAMPYAYLTGMGTLLMLVAMIPLACMPPPARSTQPTGPVWRAIAAPLADRNARRLLTYGCWFAFFNGLTAAPQNIYPKAVLKLPLRDMQWMQTVMRLGQAVLSYVIGPWSDRRGNRAILIASQVAIGAAPLFFLWADAAHPYRLVGAWVLFSAYAGINICLPSLTMLLAPRGEIVPALAAYYAFTSLFVTLGNLAGGYLFDYVRRPEFAPWWSTMRLDPFAAAFVLAFVTRTAGALLLLRVDDPRS
jgi:MFS family permease